MGIDSNPFGGVRLSGEDAAVFRREMAFAEIATKLIGHMARKVEPEVWAKGDVLENLRSLKRARDYLEAALDFPDVLSVATEVLALPPRRTPTHQQQDEERG